MIGAFRHRAVLQEKTQTPDGGGGFAESWSDVATVWCALSHRGGREIMAGDQTVAERDLVLRIRFRSDVDAAMRVLLDGRTLAIDTVRDPDGRRRFLDLVCIENRAS